MKKHLIILLGSLLIMTSCENDLSTEFSRQLPEKQMLLTNDDCVAPTACLPKVAVNHIDGLGTQISINRGIGNANCTKFRLTYSGADLPYPIVKEVQQFGYEFIYHSLEAYEVNYTISCLNPNCKYCTQGETFIKKTKDHGTTITNHDCLKTFLPCHLEPREGGFLLLIENIWNYDHENYLEVDSYTVYQSHYLEPAKAIMSGTVPRNSAVRLSSLSHDASQFYEIRFYSSACKYNTEHYLYTTFGGNELILGLNRYSLTLHKHPE